MLLRLTALVGALLLSLPARAEDPVAFQGLRVITLQGATSRCIGQPTTPLCAAETFLACTLRNDKAMCDLVGEGPYGPQKEVMERYRFASTQTMTEEDFRRLEGVEWAKPGTVAIDFDISDCDAKGHCSPFISYSVLVAKHGGDVWKVVGHGSNEDPENFAD